MRVKEFINVFESRYTIYPEREKGLELCSRPPLLSTDGGNRTPTSEETGF